MQATEIKTFLINTFKDKIEQENLGLKLTITPKTIYNSTMMMSTPPASPLQRENNNKMSSLQQALSSLVVTDETKSCPHTPLQNDVGGVSEISPKMALKKQRSSTSSLQREVTKIKVCNFLEHYDLQAQLRGKVPLREMI